MMPSRLLVALLLAVFLHLGGLIAASHLWSGLSLSPHSLPSAPIMARIVPVEHPPELIQWPEPLPIPPPQPVQLPETPIAPPPPPDPQLVTLPTPAPPPLPRVEKIPPPAPRVVEKKPLKPAAVQEKPPPSPKPPQEKKPVAPVTSTRAPRSGDPGGAPPTRRPQLAESQPDTPPGNVLGAPRTTPPPDKPPEPIEGREAGAGALSDRGQTAMVPGPGSSGGSGGAGRSGSGFGTEGSGPKEGGTSSSGDGAGLSSGRGGRGSGSGEGDGSGRGRGGGSGEGTVRPLGGYQVKPRYPEALRRRGIEGTVLLKVRVTDRGRVEAVQVERSAGQPELDQSATEAVQRWRFTPARRGSEPVAVWVLIPVEFRLDH